jgi:D-arabinose 1-dehydrogenase-like Zn-dependent alcohol dehydrogenase
MEALAGSGAAYVCAVDYAPDVAARGALDAAPGATRRCARRCSPRRGEWSSSASRARSRDRARCASASKGAACARRASRCSRGTSGSTILGALLTQLASKAGARVIAISRRPFSLEVARACGAAETIAMNDHHRIIEHVKSLTAGALCDRSIEAVGQQWPLDLAGELTKERGRLVIAGFHQDGPRQVNMFLWNWRGLDVINAHERDPAVQARGLHEAMRALADGTLDPFPLITHALPLRELGRAFELMRERPDGFMKAVVTA